MRGSPTPVQLQILKLHLEMLGKIDSAIGSLDKLPAEELKKHEEAGFGWPKCRDWEWIRRSA